MTPFVVVTANACCSRRPRRATSLLVRIALGGAAVAAYMVVTSAALNELVTGTPSQALTIEAARDETTPAAEVVSGTAFVLTISIDGPNASVDIYCDTTSDRTPLDRLHVRPEQLMDAFYRLCDILPES